MAGDEVVAQLGELISPVSLAEDGDASLMAAIDRLETLVTKIGNRELSNKLDEIIGRIYADIDRHDREVMYELFDPAPECAERLLEELKRKPQRDK